MRRSLVALALALVLPLPVWAGQVTVKEGETLSEIAERYGMSVNQLMKLNGLDNADHVEAGQTLSVPGGSGGRSGTRSSGASASGRVTVQDGDTLSEIADRHGMSVNQLMKLNGLDNADHVEAGQTLLVYSRSKSPTSTGFRKGASEHVVRSGESLSVIANGYGIGLDKLIAINGISDPDHVQEGTRLKLKSRPPVVKPANPRPVARKPVTAQPVKQPVAAKPVAPRPKPVITESKPVITKSRPVETSLTAATPVKSETPAKSEPQPETRPTATPNQPTLNTTRPSTAATTTTTPRATTTPASREAARPSTAAVSAAASSTSQAPISSSSTRRAAATTTPASREAAKPSTAAVIAAASSTSQAPISSSSTRRAAATTTPASREAAKPSTAVVIAAASPNRPVSTPATRPTSSRPVATAPRAATTTVAARSGKPDWRTYGPLQVDWSGWQPMGGSMVAPTLNAQGQSLYLAINCGARKLNATTQAGDWKTWDDPSSDYELQLVNDYCRSRS